MYPTPTESQIRNTAKEAIDTLQRVGVQGAFVGGMACLLYGNIRKPNDLDIFVLSSSRTQEHLKDLLVENNEHFYLVNSKDPYATYRVLWYRFSQSLPSSYPLRSYSTYPSYARSSQYEVRIKVDILLPGVMDIPLFPISSISRINGLPVAPFALVLLLKLQAWSQHRASSEFRFQQKQYQDHRDLKALLPIARSQGIRILPRSDAYMPEAFVQNAISRVQEHVRMYPDCRDEWTGLGFSLPRAQGVRSNRYTASFSAYRDNRAFSWDSD